MSATMDVDPMRIYFAPKQNNKGGSKQLVPVVWVEGRTHAVEIKHTLKSQQDYLMACLSTLFTVHRETPARFVFLQQFNVLYSTVIEPPFF
jgi:HrpA-like RNA helicase